MASNYQRVPLLKTEDTFAKVVIFLFTLEANSFSEFPDFKMPELCSKFITENSLDCQAEKHIEKSQSDNTVCTACCGI